MSERKTILMGFKVTPSQQQQILAKCELTGLSVSEYLRCVAMGKTIYVVKGLPEMIIAVNRIGNNLNQLVKQSYKYHNPMLEQEVMLLRQEFASIRESIRNLNREEAC